MENNVLFASLAQIFGQAPVLLVCLAGVIVALVRWRHGPTASLLVVLASALIIVGTVVSVFVTNFVVQSANESGTSAVELGRTMAIVALMGSFVRAVALGLLLAAAFVRRPVPASSALPVPLAGTAG